MEHSLMELSNQKIIYITLELLLKVLVKLFDFFVSDRESPLSTLDFMPPPGWCPAITDPYSSKLESKDAVLVSLSKVSPAK